jgi:molecular chaperone GrpE
MAEIPKKIRINIDADYEPDQDIDDETASIPSKYEDDEDRVREPINLDSHVGLADALAEAHRLAPPGTPPPTPPPAPTQNHHNGQSASSAPPPPATPPPAPAPQARVESPNDAQSAPAGNGEVESLRGQLKQANENYLRALADLQNFRRRGEEERLRVIRDGNEKLIKEILPILDDFDLSMSAAKQSESYEQLVNGVEAILRKFSETLVKQGIEPIESVGKKFDPDYHEAVMLDDSTDEPDETITAELRKGYTLHNRVIRPSLVKVAKQG